MNAICRLCGNLELSVVFDGPIRDGGVGAGMVTGFKVARCASCSMSQLEPLPDRLPEFYETHEYRTRWDLDASPQAIQLKYDHEQGERVARIGIQTLRGAKVVDLGASAGVFLDAVSGVADETIAVEPAEIYSDYLKANHSRYFPYPEDAIAAGISADVVTCFDVIEHLESPRQLVEQAHSLLSDGGLFVLSMPSHDDILLTVAGETFRSFFYQTAHINYFDRKSVRKLLDDCGFGNINFGYLHKYELPNLLQWARFGKPGRFTEVEDLLPREVSQHFVSSLESAGLSSHHFITARKI